MAQEQKSLLTNAEDAGRGKRLAQLTNVLSRWFAKWSEVFPTHEVTRMQMATYIETLQDLTPNELEEACREVTRTAEVFPKPGHIRKALAKVNFDDQRHERPSYLDEHTTTEEEREAALEYSRKLKEVLLAQEDKEVRANPVNWDNNRPIGIPFHDGYKQWLTEQYEKDEAAKKLGLEPLPRSREEKLAIFYNLPRSERMRLQRKAEWRRALA